MTLEQDDDLRDLREAAVADGTQHFGRAPWVAIALLVVGFVVLGVAFVLPDFTDLVVAAVVAGVGVVILLIGSVVGWRARIMENVH